jgi:hypothetical protein
VRVAIARALRRIADHFDKPAPPAYEPQPQVLSVTMPEPTVPWITERHDRPDGVYEVVPDFDEAVWARSRGGPYL